VKITAILSVILFILLSTAFLSSCSREETETGTDPVITEIVQEIDTDPVIMDEDIVENIEEE